MPTIFDYLCSFSSPSYSPSGPIEGACSSYQLELPTKSEGVRVVVHKEEKLVDIHYSVGGKKKRYTFNLFCAPEALVYTQEGTLLSFQERKAHTPVFSPEIL